MCFVFREAGHVGLHGRLADIVLLLRGGPVLEEFAGAFELELGQFDLTFPLDDGGIGGGDLFLRRGDLLFRLGQFGRPA